jgi:hypothetical protein
MAVPADKTVRGMGRSDVTQERVLLDEYNKMVTQFRALCAKLDLDAGVTSTDYAATLANADAASPAKITPT